MSRFDLLAASSSDYDDSARFAGLFSVCRDFTLNLGKPFGSTRFRLVVARVRTIRLSFRKSVLNFFGF